MKQFFRLLVLTALSGPIMAQSVIGLTHRADTSFTVAGTYAKLLKTYPAIQRVDTTLPPTVRVDRNMTYANVGDYTLQLDVFYPAQPAQKARPAVLLIHGGGWRSGNRSMERPIAQQLAANGFVAITAGYRLSTEALYPAAVHDLKTAIRWLRAHAGQYQIDTNRVAAMGCSAGGQLAALLGSTGNRPALEGTGGYGGHSSAVQAVVDVDGILAFIHPESGEGDDSKSTSAATYWFGASKDEQPDRWREASALTYVGPQTPPTLFLNSSIDRMHAGRDDMVRQLKTLGIYTETHTFADAPHPFWLFHPWFEPTMQYTLQFLKKVL